MKQEKTGDKILTAARSEFANFGYEGARIDRIAKKAGANKAMIYYYFKSKESLYETILTSLYTTFFDRLSKVFSEEVSPDNRLFAIIDTFMTHVSTIDSDYIRVMLREIGSGGKYFRKIAIPRLIVPMLSLVIPVIEEGKKNGQLKDIHDRYTFLSLVGAVVFFNAIKLTIGDTDFGKDLFTGNSLDEYKKNLITIYKSGMLK